MCTQQSNSFEVHWAHKSFQVWMRINRFKPERKCMLERSYNNQFFISNFGNLVLTLAAKRMCFIRIDQNITDWNDLSITLGLNYISNGFAMNCLNSTKCRIVGSFFYFFIRLIHVRIHSSHSRQNKTKKPYCTCECARQSLDHHHYKHKMNLFRNIIIGLNWLMCVSAVCQKVLYRCECKEKYCDIGRRSELRIYGFQAPVSTQKKTV